MGLIGMDELGPMGVQPGGLGNQASPAFQRFLRAFQQQQETVRQNERRIRAAQHRAQIAQSRAAANERARQEASRTGARQGVERSRNLRDRPMPGITERVGTDETAGPSRAGGGGAGAFARAFGWADRRTPEPQRREVDYELVPELSRDEPGNRIVEWDPETQTYKGYRRKQLTSDEYMPGAHRAQRRAPVNPRGRAPSTYERRGGFFQGFLDAIFSERQIAMPGVSMPVVPDYLAEQRRQEAQRKAELAKREQAAQAARQAVQQAEQRRRQEAQLRAEIAKREQEAQEARRVVQEIDEERRKRWQQQQRQAAWSPQDRAAVAAGRMTPGEADLRASRGAPQVPTTFGYQQRPAIYVPPRQPVPVGLPRQPILQQPEWKQYQAVGAPEPTSASQAWHGRFGTDLEAIRARGRATSPQARQAYQGQATGVGPTQYVVGGGYYA